MQIYPSHRRPRISLFVAALALATSHARAEQFTLMDVTFTFTKNDADTSSPSQSHYYVTSDMLAAQVPVNWLSPVDYRNGSVHVRTEVIDKPAGGEVTQWTLCYIPNVGIGAGYGCTGSGTYTEEGVYERDVSMTSWWQNDQIDWSSGIAEMHLVIKDSDGGGGHAHKREDHEKFFPTTMRITMVQVSAGSSYDEALVPEFMDSGTGGDTGSGGDQSPPDPNGAGGSGAGGVEAAGGFPGAGGSLVPGDAADDEPSDTTDEGDQATSVAGPGACSHGVARTSGWLWVLFATAALTWTRRRRFTR